MFKKWLVETIIVPPHMTHRFFREASKLFQDTEPLILSVNSDEVYKIAKNWSNSSSEMRAIIDMSDDYHMIQRRMDRIKFVDFYENWMNIINNDSEGKINYDDRNLKRTADNDLLQEIQEFYKKHKDQFHYISDIIQSLEENKDFIQSEDGNYEEIFTRMKSFQEAIQKLLDMNKWYKIYCEKIEAIFKLKSHREAEYYTNQKIHPETDHTETLYHATVATSKILKEGFRTRDELGIGGALGGGPGDVISFTSDLKIAESIVWVLRRAVMIAQGRFSPKDLEKMMITYGINDAEKEKMMINQKDSWGTYEKANNQKEWMFHLFRNWMLRQSKIYDPWLSFVSAKDFESVNIKDIGIIGAEVKMNKSHQYLWAMEEYRVPISAILSIWRVPYKGKETSYWN